MQPSKPNAHLIVYRLDEMNSYNIKQNRIRNRRCFNDKHNSNSMDFLRLVLIRFISRVVLVPLACTAEDVGFPKKKCTSCNSRNSQASLALKIGRNHPSKHFLRGPSTPLSLRPGIILVGPLVEVSSWRGVWKHRNRYLPCFC